MGYLSSTSYNNCSFLFYVFTLIYLKILYRIPWGCCHCSIFQEIYLIYKEREDIEQCFDAMKNGMENDKTYLRDNDAIRGYFFVSFISLYIHYRLLEILRINDLIGKHSVNELLFELSKVYAVQYSDDKIELNEIPKRVETIMKKINMDILPKN